MARRKKNRNSAHNVDANRRLADHCVAKRECLGGCDKLFVSKGPGNRVCSTCADRHRVVRGSIGRAHLETLKEHL